MKSFWGKALFGSLILGLLFCVDGFAQCAMCGAVAQDGAESGTYGAGLNQAILYLMFIPYVLLGFLFFYFFRKRIFLFFREFSRLQ